MDFKDCKLPKPQGPGKGSGPARGCFSESESLSDILLTGIQEDSRLSDLLEPDAVARLPFHADPEVRSLAAEILADRDPKIDAEALLLQLARDRDPLVRTNAIDSLSHYRTGNSYDVCVAALADPDPLVRAYAAFGTAVVGRSLGKTHALPTLADTGNQETDPQVLAALGEARYILGDSSGLQDMFDLYPAGDCSLQCAIVNHLQEILNLNNRAQILAFAQRMQGAASAPAAEKSMEDLLDRLNEIRR